MQNIKVFSSQIVHGNNLTFTAHKLTKAEKKAAIVVLNKFIPAEKFSRDLIKAGELGFLGSTVLDCIRGNLSDAMVSFSAALPFIGANIVFQAKALKNLPEIAAKLVSEKLNPAQVKYALKIALKRQGGFISSRLYNIFKGNNLDNISNLRVGFNKPSLQI